MRAGMESALPPCMQIKPVLNYGILIIHPDRRVLDRFAAHPAARTHPPLLAAEGREALRMIGQPSYPIAASFIHPDLFNPGPGAIERALRLKRPGAPLLELPEDVSYADLLETVAPPTAVLARLPSPWPALPPATQDFVPAPLLHFLGPEPSRFDLFLQWNDSRPPFQVLQAGERFEEPRLHFYLSRGIYWLWIRKAQMEQALRLPLISKGWERTPALPAQFV